MATSFEMISVLENKRKIKDPPINLIAMRRRIWPLIGILFALGSVIRHSFLGVLRNLVSTFRFSLNPNSQKLEESLFSDQINLVSEFRFSLNPVTRKLSDYRRSMAVLENTQRFDFFEIPHRSAVIMIQMSPKSIVTGPRQFASMTD